MKEEEKKEVKNKLRPVIFVRGDYPYHRQNIFQQNLLLKALQVTQDPIKLKEMIGVKTVAEVYRTLDKMAIRKEYHEALSRQGLDLDSIVQGIKSEAVGSDSSAVRLSAYKILLKSLGLDEYKETAESTAKSWEDVLIEQINKEKEIKELPSPKFVQYEVIEPEVPETEKRQIEKEEKFGKNLYG